MNMSNRIKKLMEAKKLISFQEYDELISLSNEDYSRYRGLHKRYGSSKSFGLTDYLYNGMLKWPDDKSPQNWGGPYPLNYVRISITKTNTSKTEVDVFKERRHYVNHSTHHRSLSVLNRVGYNDAYWVRPYVDRDGISHPDHLCTYSEMTEDELKTVEQAETPDEHLYHQLRAIATLNSRDMLPKNEYTVEHPYRLHLCGNDDCSYSMYYMPEIQDEILSMEAYLTLASPSWSQIENFYHFTN